MIVRMLAGGGLAVAVEVVDIIVKIFLEHALVLFYEVSNRFIASRAHFIRVGPSYPTDVCVEPGCCVHHRGTNLARFDVSDLGVRKMDVRIGAVVKVRVESGNVIWFHFVIFA